MLKVRRAALGRARVWFCACLLGLALGCGGDSGPGWGGGLGDGGTDPDDSGAAAGSHAAGSGGAGGAGGSVANGPFQVLTTATSYDGLAQNALPKPIAVVGSKAFFVVSLPTVGVSLHVTDGTAAGTRLVAQGLTAITHDFFSELNGGITFVHNTPAAGSEPWFSDGTPEGTHLIKDINPGSMPSYSAVLGRAGKYLYFGADDGVHGFEVWATDGTEAGTRMLRDFNPGKEGQYAIDIHGFAWNDKFCFFAKDATLGQEIWITDGTVAGTQMLTPGAAGGLWGVIGGQFIVFKDRLYFGYARTNQDDTQLWTSDGTAAGTRLFKELPRTGTPEDFNILGDKLLFNAYTGEKAPNGASLKGLFATDGTPEGTTLIASVANQPNDQNMARVGNKLVFNGYTLGSPAYTYTLWATDGTTGGTLELGKLNAGSDDHYAAVGSKLVFYGSASGELDYEPWVTDGSAAGTLRLADLVPGTKSSFGTVAGDLRQTQTNLVTFGAKVYFFTLADAPSRFYETDGTSGGTRSVAPQGVSKFEVNRTPVPFGNSLLMFGTLDGKTELLRYTP